MDEDGCFNNKNNSLDSLIKMENDIDFAKSIAEEEEPPEEEIHTSAKRCRLVRQVVQLKKLCAKEERNASIKKVLTRTKLFEPH